MSISITSPMQRTAAADYIALTCKMALDAALAVLNTATVVRRISLPGHRVTVMACPGLDGWAYRVSQSAE